MVFDSYDALWLSVAVEMVFACDLLHSSATVTEKHQDTLLRKCLTKKLFDCSELHGVESDVIVQNITTPHTDGENHASNESSLRKYTLRSFIRLVAFLDYAKVHIYIIY